MTKRKTPQQKKALFYQKDHHVNTEYPKAFARQWPRKKARANRKYRRQVEQTLTVKRRRDQREDEEKLHIQSLPIRRDTIRKWGPPITMQEWVTNHLDNRFQRTAWNYFKHPYERGRHREPFLGFLKNITSGQSQYSRRQAQWLNQFLEPPEPLSDSGQGFSRNPRIQCVWLRAFFSDEPEWERHLRNWIRGLLS